MEERRSRNRDESHAAVFDLLREIEKKMARIEQKVDGLSARTDRMDTRQVDHARDADKRMDEMAKGLASMEGGMKAMKAVFTFVTSLIGAIGAILGTWVSKGSPPPTP